MILKKRHVASIILAMSSNILRFNPSISSFLFNISKYISEFTKIEQWKWDYIIFSVTTILIFIILQTRIGNGFYWVYQNIETFIVFLIKKSLNIQGRRYDYGALELQRDISSCIRDSSFMYAIMLAGYKISFEDERFILDELRRLPNDNGKDIRFLFLDKDSEDWITIANTIINNTPDLRDLGIDGYSQYCSIAQRALESIPSVHIGYYQRSTNWRLYIFDNRIFVSRYCLPPAAPFRASRDVAIVSYGANDPMYDWLYGEFRRHAPPDWQEALPGSLSRQDTD